MSLPIPNLNLPPELKPSHETPETARTPRREGNLTIWNDIEYCVNIGYRPMRMDVYIPDTDDLPPIVVYIHGGAFMFGTRHENAVSSPTWKDLLEAGYAVAAIEYRLAGEAVFPANLHDVTAAIRWIKKYQTALKVDGSKLATFGESAGGYLATFAGMNLKHEQLIGNSGVEETDTSVQAVVAWSPVTDVNAMDAPIAHAPQQVQQESPNAIHIGQTIKSNPDLARWASPITHANSKAAPMLILQGEADDMVSVDQGESLAKQLHKFKVEAVVKNYAGAPHIFFGMDAQQQRTESVNFLNRIFNR